MRRSKAFLVALAALFVCGHLRASDEKVNKFISNGGTIGYLILGAGLPLVRDGSDGKMHTLRTLDSLAVSLAAAEGLKQLTHVKRPDSNAHDSFPSEHATAAFTVATMESQFHPSEAPLWFLGAAAIANSRVQIHKHRWADVIGGAVLGYGTARLELSSPRGLLIYPFVSDEGGYGVVVTSRF